MNCFWLLCLLFACGNGCGCKGACNGSDRNTCGCEGINKKNTGCGCDKDDCGCNNYSATPYPVFRQEKEDCGCDKQRQNEKAVQFMLHSFYDSCFDLNYDQ